MNRLIGFHGLIALSFLILNVYPTAGENVNSPVIAHDRFISHLKASPARAVAADPAAAVDAIRISRMWDGPICRSRVTNTGGEPIHLKEIILFDFDHQLPPDTPIQAECFQMLAQIIGTLAKPEDFGGEADRNRHRMAEPPDMRAACGMLMLAPAGSQRILLGYTSCRKFNGRFYFNGKRLQVALDMENLPIAPGKSWDMEEFLIAAGPDREKLFDALTAAVEKNHPRLKHDPVPTGWCSWYCFAENVTPKNIMDNLDFIAKNIPQLKYIQIDDGYQPQMGDWLDSGPLFAGGIQSVLKQIRQRGFEPGLWVAPFIAGQDSKLFQQHPDWFIKDADGKPLRSDTVGFGGWRLAPWYCLDGTHPEAQKFLENLFRTLHRDWGCTYFKLDANYWGAIHSGKHYDPDATRVEAYRRGMEAILRGAGDAFILGCNHPMWPSLGLIHGARMSYDINQSWDTFALTARQNFYRNWMNGRFWWNDPDCIMLEGQKMPENESVFHATAIYAVGGMTLDSDDLTRITPPQLEMIRKLVPPTGVPAQFADETFTIGRIPLPDREMVAVFNPSDQPAAHKIPLPIPVTITDYWTDEDLGRHEGSFSLPDLPPHSARLLTLRPVPNK